MWLPDEALVSIVLSFLSGPTLIYSIAKTCPFYFKIYRKSFCFSQFPPITALLEHITLPLKTFH